MTGNPTTREYVAREQAMIHVIIPGEPVAQGRPRFARQGRFVRAIDPAKSRSWKAEARAAMVIARPAGWQLLQGPLQCTIVAGFSCPKSDYRKAPRPARPHAKRPDIENVAKAVLDAGTGVLWVDDAQVALLTVTKTILAQGEAPYVYVGVSPLLEEESDA